MGRTWMLGYSQMTSGLPLDCLHGTRTARLKDTMDWGYFDHLIETLDQVYIHVYISPCNEDIFANQDVFSLQGWPH